MKWRNRCVFCFQHVEPKDREPWGDSVAHWGCASDEIYERKKEREYMEGSLGW